jgi:quinolinate synthase
MNRITLAGIYESLRDMKYEITIPPDVAVRAKVAVDRMLAVGRGKSG